MVIKGLDKKTALGERIPLKWTKESEMSSKDHSDVSDVLTSVMF